MKTIQTPNKVKKVTRFFNTIPISSLILTLLIVSLFLPSTVSAESSNAESSLSSCCVGMRGNVDNDVLDQIDISDLVLLVAYMFSGGDEPPCLEEADVDGSDEIDISDLVQLVAFMFSGGTEPTDCPIITWEKTFGGADNDYGYSVCETSGGYIITGHIFTNGTDSDDAYLFKTDFDGTIVWEKTFGGTSRDICFSISETSDLGFIISGQTQSYGAGNEDFYLIKTLSDGTLIWEKTYGGTNSEEAHSVCETSDSGFIIIGNTQSYGAGNRDVFLVKTDNNGTLVWQKTFGGTSSDGGNSVCETSDGGYIITGWTYSYGIAGDVYLIKTNSDGTLVWEKTFGGINDDRGFSVCETSDGGYIITGWTYSYGAGSRDVYLMKTDSIGTLIWEKTFGGTNDDYGLSICETSDGSYIITGYSVSYGAGGSDVYLIKTDSVGTLIWEKTFGGISDDFGYSVFETSDAGYIITGNTQSSGAGSRDIYLIKTDSDGNVY